jgi:hypothetical protein
MWRLDRWGRSMTDVLATLQELNHLGVGFVSLAEALDLTTPAGRLWLACSRFSLSSNVRFCESEREGAWRRPGRTANDSVGPKTGRGMPPKGGTVEVLQMAVEDQCEHDRLVRVR